jgi:hypothetical protein
MVTPAPRETWRGSRISGLLFGQMELRFASAPSASSAQRCLLSHLKGGLIASRSITATSTDDADGADGIFSTRAHPDHSRPCPAFSSERDLDAQRREKRLRPPQSTGERPRIFAHAVPISSRALCAHKRKRSDALPVHMARSTMIARTQVATGSASMVLSMAALRFAA